MIKKNYQNAFTVIEVLVIVVIIVILVSISYFMIETWRKDSAMTQVKNELTQAATELRQYRNFNSTYPATGSFSSLYNVGEGVTLNYTRRANGSFCLNGVSQKESGVKWYVDSNVSATDPRQGTCS